MSSGIANHTFFVPVYVWGFYWGVVNIFVCGLVVFIAHRWYRLRMAAAQPRLSSVFRVSWYLLCGLVIFPAVAIISLGPFFGPQVALKITQKV